MCNEEDFVVAASETVDRESAYSAHEYRCLQYMLNVSPMLVRK